MESFRHFDGTSLHVTKAEELHMGVAGMETLSWQERQGWIGVDAIQAVLPADNEKWELNRKRARYNFSKSSTKSTDNDFLPRSHVDSVYFLQIACDVSVGACASNDNQICNCGHVVAVEICEAFRHEVA